MPLPSPHRLKFAARFAGWHFIISLAVALLTAALVFGLWYPAPYRLMLGVAGIYLLILVVDVVCGPLLTLIVASPRKSLRERTLDFALIGLVQLAALAYGMHSVWLARPVVLAFETDRLVVVTANEIQLQDLALAPPALQHLPWWGVQQVNLRPPRDSEEFLRSIDEAMQGLSPAMRPGWWLPWDSARPAMQTRARPLSELLARRPQDAAALHAAIARTDLNISQLRYLPLVSSKTMEWIALLNEQLDIVGHAPVDGF